ncbi:MAG: AAA family ATPase [Limnohabitans sp.]
MRLTRLEARDFAQHAALDLDLATIDQAVIVGENGSGKSTLMDAVVWCLFGRGTERSRGTDELIRDDRLGMWVRTTWDRSGETVVVQRSRSVETKAGESSLSLVVGQQGQTKHTIGETQAVIERLVGLDRDQLLAGPFMEQGQQDKLMRYDPAPRKALFASLCGADRFEPAHDVAKMWRDQYAIELSMLEGKIPAIRARIDRELDLMRDRDAAAAKQRTAVAAVTELEAEIGALREEAESLREKALRAESLTARLADLNREDAGVLRDIERLSASIATLTSIAESQPEEPADEPEPEPVSTERLAELDRAAEEVAASRRATANWEASLTHQREAHAKAEAEGLCDRCPYRGVEMKPEDQAALERRLAEGKAWLAEHENAAVDAQRLRSAAGAREREIQLVRQGNEARRAAYVTAMTRWSEARQTLHGETYALTTRQQSREAIATEIAAVQSERLRLIQTDDRAREVAEQMTAKAGQLTMARSFQSEAERAHAVAEAALADVAKAQKELADLDLAWTETRGTLDAHELVVRMFHRDGLPTMIVEATIPLVEQRANELLERMPGEMSVELVTQKQTKKGTWTDTLDIVVVEAGRVRPYGMLSGAERFRVDLALRLGLASVLLHRSGSKFETLWLDEPFAAQDRKALESLLQSVSAVVDEFGLTLVVTHQQEVADRFGVRIEVRDAGFGTASVEVAA